MWYIYTQWILLSHKKGQNLAICDNMGGPWGYYANWNKSDKDRQTPYASTHMWNKNPKQTKITKINEQIK